MTADTFLFNASSIFFAVWIAVVTAVTITAFGRDLLPREQFDAAQQPPAEPRTR